MATQALQPPLRKVVTSDALTEVELISQEKARAR